MDLHRWKEGKALRQASKVRRRDVAEVCTYVSDSHALIIPRSLPAKWIGEL